MSTPQHNPLRTFIYFDAVTGEIHGRTVSIYSSGSPDAIVTGNTPAGHMPIEGAFERLTQRIDVNSKAVVARESRPEEVAAQRRLDALAAIAALETKGIRATRELALNQPGASDRVAAIDSEIAALRTGLA